ncbi:MAG: hypothetical protein Q9163_004653 [Psora crenata]
MDIVNIVSGYVTRMTSNGHTAMGSSSAKMKILLLDSGTVRVYYVQGEIDADTVIDYYHFSNIIRKSSLERLAEADSNEVVKSVQEYFADYIAINPDLFSLDLGFPKQRLWSGSPDIWDNGSLQRCTEGIVALLLSLKKKPLIRYEKNSLMAKKLATQLRYEMIQEDQLFDFRKTDTAPILLILDRRDDPITPLLTQWTYQAMVHELLGIYNGKVDLTDVPDVRLELKEIVLSQDQDPFFKKNMYLNFGDLGGNIKDYVEQYQSMTKSSTTIDSIADMKRFVEDYPQFRKLSGNVSKHVTLVGELSRRVGANCLLDVSELEQSLACNDNHTNDLKNLQRLMQYPQIPAENKLRLVALYAIRYEKHPSNALPILLDLLTAAGNISPTRAELVPKLLTYHHSLQASPPAGGFSDLFESSSFFFAARGRFKGLKGIENVYTQHSPRLEVTLQNLIKARLKEQQYPFVEAGGTTRDKPQDIIIFVIGGTTYEEAKMVAQVNASSPGVRVVLGGTTIHNSTTFLKEMEDAVSSWPDKGPLYAAERLRREAGR